MFMGNDEIKNTLALTRIKIRSSRVMALRVLLIMGLVYLAVIILTLINVLKYKAVVSDILIYDYSYFHFLAIVVVAITTNIRYKQINDVYAIYPQTVSSRYLSTQAFLHLWLGVLTILPFIVYVIQFVTYKLLSEFNSNIILAFRTDLEMILMGILIFFLYGMLAIALVSLIGVLIRKFGTIAIACFTLLIAFILTSEDGLWGSISRMLSYLTKEQRIGIFLIKVLITWLLLFVSALLINKYTVYYKEQRKYSNALVTAIGIVALIVISIIRTYQADNGGIFISAPYMSSSDSSIWQDRVLYVTKEDTSNSGPITVKTNFDLEEDNMHLNTSPSINNADTIKIQYRLPVRLYNNYNLTELTKPSLTAKLEGNVLNINYDYIKNTKVVYLSPWFVMKQFERYQNRDLFFIESNFYSSRSISNGHVSISAK